MTLTVVVMIVIGIIFIFASFFISESFSRKQDNFSADLLTVNDNYEFSEREKGIIKRKVEDAIAQQARDILYETNESLANMANEKTMALGDYAVTVCEEIERNHKEVMFLYSMLEDKQKDIMNTVGEINKSQEEMKNTIKQAETTMIHSERIEKSLSSKLEQTAEQSDKSIAAGNTTKNDNQVTVTKKNEPKTGIEMVAEMQSDAATEKKAVEKSEKAEEVDTDSISKVEQDQKVMEEKDLNSASDEEAINEVEDTDLTDDVKDDFEELLDSIEDVDLDNVLEEEFEQSGNSNDIILEMYRNGDSILAIAKELGLGVGEVKLVIDLYQGE